MSDKIINSFQQRRQLAQDLADLAQTTNEAQLIAGVRKLAHTYPADLLAAALLKHLDTPSSQLRGGLGHLATLLPPEEIVPALRNAAANRANSAQTRVTAALIMERFLGEPVSPALVADLEQTNEVAFQSLREAVEEGATNRRVLLDYVTQMRQTPESVAFMVMELLERLEPAQRIELLRLIALDDRPAVARAALQRLERLANAVPEPALAALTALATMLPPDLAAQTARGLRKLQFSGLRHRPPAPTAWRALLSPADLGAHLSLWFVKMPDAAAATGALLVLVIQPRQGITQAFGNDMLDRSQLPEPRAVGHSVAVRTDRGEKATLLEIPFDVGRRLLLTAQAAHYGYTRALPDDYRLFGDALWRFDSPQIDPALESYFAVLQSGDTDASDAPPADPAALIADARQLLAHPVMAGWVLQPPLLARPAEANGAAWPLAHMVQAVLRDLEQRPERAQVIETLAAGLRLQALWLALADNVPLARRALRLAAAMPHLALSVNPLLTLLVEGSLRQAQNDANELI